MGLDVIFTKEKNDTLGSLCWNDPDMESFPFSIQTEEIPGDDYEEPYSYSFVPGITGMFAYPDRDVCVSFQGKGYDRYASQAQLPYSFYQDMTPEELKKQAEMLKNLLAVESFVFSHLYPDENVDERVVYGQSIVSIKNLSILLNWAVEKGYGTNASY
jgi:hypothetical protein